MNAHTPQTDRMSDLQLIAAVRAKAAATEAEIEAAFRFREGSDIREWHLERADQGMVELLGLINGRQHQAAWDRLAESHAPLVVDDLPSFLRPLRVELQNEWPGV